MASTDPLGELGRRERQIMDVVHRLGRASIADVLAQLADPPSYSAVRTMLRYLESKGHLRHERDGKRFLYLPTARRETTKRSALRHLVSTFFDGSRARAVVALLDAPGAELTDDEVRQIRAIIERSRAREE